MPSSYVLRMEETIVSCGADRNTPDPHEFGMSRESFSISAGYELTMRPDGTIAVKGKLRTVCVRPLWYIVEHRPAAPQQPEPKKGKTSK